jgi:hypothetical protein
MDLKRSNLMTFRRSNKFAEKYGQNIKPDRLIEDKILRRIKNSELACAVAFKIAEELQVSPDAVGMTADLLNVKLVKCKLGLFGYKPQKKIVKTKKSVSQDLIDAVTDALVDGRLSCQSAWDIASRFKVHKMEISSVCEFTQIKINKCQLGAF